MRRCRDPACAGGEGSFAAILTFSIPLETRQEFALLPLPFPPAHRMGMDPGGGGTKLGNAPFLGGEGRGRGWCAWMHTCCTPSPGCTITPAQGSTWDAHTRAELTPVSAPGPAAAQRYPERSGAERGLRCPPQPWGLVPGGSGGPLPSPRRAGASGAAWSCPGGLDTPFSFKLMAVP